MIRYLFNRYLEQKEQNLSQKQVVVGSGKRLHPKSPEISTKIKPLIDPKQIRLRQNELKLGNADQN